MDYVKKQLIKVYNDKLNKIFNIIEELDDGFIYYEVIFGRIYDYDDVIRFFSYEDVNDFSIEFKKFYDKNYENWSEEYQFELELYIEYFQPLVEEIDDFNGFKDILSCMLNYLEINDEDTYSKILWNELV